MTQAGRLPAPVPKQTNGPCARPGRFRKRLFCAFGQSQARLKKIPELGRGGRKEREREGGGRGQECVGEGGGNKTRLCTKGEKKRTIRISLFSPLK